MTTSSVRRSLIPLVLALAVAGSAGIPAHAAKPKQPPSPASTPSPAVEPALFKSLKWREVGPYRGGRSAAVTGVPSDRNTYYFGATGGGVWKTTDGRRTWKSVSDGTYGGSIGAIQGSPGTYFQHQFYDGPFRKALAPIPWAWQGRAATEGRCGGLSPRRPLTPRGAARAPQVGSRALRPSIASLPCSRRRARRDSPGRR